MCIHINLLNEQCSCIHVCLSACTLYFCTPLPPTNSRSLLYPPIHAPSLLTQTHLPLCNTGTRYWVSNTQCQCFGANSYNLVHQVHHGMRGTPGPKHVDRVCSVLSAEAIPAPSLLTKAELSAHLQWRAICPSALHPLSSDPDSSAGQGPTRWARN